MDRWIDGEMDYIYIPVYGISTCPNGPVYISPFTPTYTYTYAHARRNT